MAGDSVKGPPFLAEEEGMRKRRRPLTEGMTLLISGPEQQRACQEAEAPLDSLFMRPSGCSWDSRGSDVATPEQLGRHQRRSQAAAAAPCTWLLPSWFLPPSNEGPANSLEAERRSLIHVLLTTPPDGPGTQESMWERELRLRMLPGQSSGGSDECPPSSHLYCTLLEDASAFELRRLCTFYLPGTK